MTVCYSTLHISVLLPDTSTETSSSLLTSSHVHVFLTMDLARSTYVVEPIVERFVGGFLCINPSDAHDAVAKFVA